MMVGERPMISTYGNAFAMFIVQARIPGTPTMPLACIFMNVVNLPCEG
jgi:hypothetical protein